jgi:adenylate cyclase
LNKKLKKLFIYNFIAICIAIFISLFSILYPTLLNSFDNIIRDYMFQIRGTLKQNDNVVIVDIDEKSLNKVGQWPWGRDKVAKILYNLTNAGVGIIGLDIVFSEADGKSPYKIFKEHNRSTKGIEDYDNILQKAISSTPTILGYQFELDDKKSYISKAIPIIPATIIERHKPKYTSNIIKANGVILNINQLQKVSYSSGFFNNIPDSSGMVRSVPLVIQYDNQMYPSLSLEIVRIALGSNNIIINYFKDGIDSIKIKNLTIPTDIHGRMIINYRGEPKTFKYISAVDILDNNFNKKDINSKIVLIGTSASGLLDLRATPFSPVFPGVEVHATAIDNMLMDDFLSKPIKMEFINIAIIFFISILTVMLLTYTPFWLNPIIMIVLSFITISYLYYKIFDTYLVYNTFLPLLTIFIATIVTTFMDYILEIKKEKRIKNKFAQKVSKEVMDELLKDGNNSEFQAMQREITVYFSDVRNFTNISEELKEPKILIDFLNDYMTPMTDIIVENKGTVDKYIGDAIMAYWNAPSKVENHADLAVSTTLKQLSYLETLNNKIRLNEKYIPVVNMSKEKGLAPIDIGIGINTGNAIIGEMGSSQRSDYTVIGDSVNLGARLESLCKYYNSKCNISHYTKALLVNDYIFRFLDYVTVKGKKEPIEIWQVIDFDGDDYQYIYNIKKDKLKKILLSYENAIVLYLKENFKESLSILNKIKDEDITNRNIYDIYINRCQHYIDNPDIKFNKVYTHTTKG